MGVRIRERNGAWWAFINHDKQRKAKRIGVGEAGKKAAKEVARQIQARLALGQSTFNQSKPDLPTIEMYLRTWLKEHAQVNCKPSTYAQYKCCVQHVILPEFGTFPLDQLSTERVRGLIEKHVKAGKSKSTIRNYLVPLRTAYAQAVEDGLVMKNPTGKLGKLLKHAKSATNNMNPLIRSETVTLLEAARIKSSLLYPLLLCAVRTGLRRGELIGLQWGDLELDTGYLLVRRSVVRGQVGLPKNGKVRRVDLSSQLCTELKTRREIRELEALSRGVILRLDEPVFLFPMGCRWDERNLEKVWHRTLKASGIRRIRLHDLRHTFASQLIEQGAHPKYIQEQLGHSSTTMTMDTYGHLFPNRNKGLVDKIGCNLGATW